MSDEEEVLGPSPRVAEYVDREKERVLHELEGRASANETFGARPRLLRELVELDGALQFLLEDELIPGSIEL
jgi:hypothetical protein